MRLWLVHDDDVARTQGRRKDVADIGFKPVAVDRTVQDHRCDHAAQPQAGDESGRLAVAVRETHPQACAAPTPSVAAGHVGRSPCFVDEDQTLGIEVGLGFEPGATLGQDVRAVLLDRVAGLFFRVIPRR